MISKKSSPPDTKIEIASGWMKCPGCAGIVFSREIERNMSVCTTCGYHFRISARRRIEITIDDGSFSELFSELASNDPLTFVDKKPYPLRISEAREKSGEEEAVVTGVGSILGYKVILSVMDFEFMGGSMGSVVGEKITRAVECALDVRVPFISFSASGGARMQEGLISLMQMAKTTAALTRLKEAAIPYISVLTDPTTGGVAASFGMLGDIIIAEPGAIIGFAGRRVIEQTINEKPPEDFQKAEELLKNGMVDMIVERKFLKLTLKRLLAYLSPQSPE